MRGLESFSYEDENTAPVDVATDVKDIEKVEQNQAIKAAIGSIHGDEFAQAYELDQPEDARLWLLAEIGTVHPEIEAVLPKETETVVAEEAEPAFRQTVEETETTVTRTERQYDVAA